MIQQINSADDDLLNLLKDVLDNYKKGKVVAYGTDGKSFSQEQYTQSIEAAEREVDIGNYTTQSDLEKEVQNW
jgi:hypothetical protein